MTLTRERTNNNIIISAILLELKNRYLKGKAPRVITTRIFANHLMETPGLLGAVSQLSGMSEEEVKNFYGLS